MKPEPILVNAERTPSQAPPAYVENAIQSPEPQALCSACGTHHGSLTGELRCMRDAIRALRGVIRKLNAQLGPYNTAVKNRNAILARDKRSLEGMPEEVAALKVLRDACGRV
jgi:hypothetical protein